MNLFFARHGETDWNRQKRIQGSADTDLNESGVAQAALLAEARAAWRDAARGAAHDTS